MRLMNPSHALLGLYLKPDACSAQSQHLTGSCKQLKADSIRRKLA